MVITSRETSNAPSRPRIARPIIAGAECEPDSWRILDLGRPIAVIGPTMT